MNTNDIIFSHITPKIKSPIITYRISGNNLLGIFKILFNIIPENRKVYSKSINIDQNEVDFVNSVYFKSPKTFTGQDIIEFSIHGSLAICSILEN